MKLTFKQKIKELLLLFLVFLKIGTFTFGGGYAMISLLENECVQKKKWLTSEDFFKIITVSETTPGPIAINMATYIGYKKEGFLGSIIATLGVVFPAFAIMFVISLFFNNLLEYPVIAHAFTGIKAGVAVLILFSGIKLMMQIRKSIFALILMVLALAANLAISLLSLKFSTIYLILIGGAVGFVAFLIANKDNLKKKTASSDAAFDETTDKTPNAILDETTDKTPDATENEATVKDALNDGENRKNVENNGENTRQEDKK